MFGTINPDVDYPGILNGVTLVKAAIDKFQAAGCRIEIPHPHRLWEYGTAVQLALNYATLKNCSDMSVLNVGSGWDALGPTLAELDFQITECEPDEGCRNDRDNVNTQLTKTGHTPILVLNNSIHALPDKRFDLVYCISVLEHVPDECNAWKRLAERVLSNGNLFITVDCVPEAGKPYTSDGCRTINYTLAILKDRVDMLQRDCGMRIMWGVDYTYHGNQVFDYSFFRVGLRKVLGG